MKLLLEDTDTTIIETDEIVVCRKWVSDELTGPPPVSASSPAILVIFTGGARATLRYADDKARDEDHERIGYMSGAR